MDDKFIKIHEAKIEDFGVSNFMYTCTQVGFPPYNYRDFGDHTYDGVMAVESDADFTGHSKLEDQPDTHIAVKGKISHLDNDLTGRAHGWFKARFYQATASCATDRVYWQAHRAD
jgi:hypothetical protein